MSRSIRNSARLLVILLAALCTAPAVFAEDAGLDAGLDAGVNDAVAAAPSRAAEVRALLQGTLDVAIDPQSLFDVDLSDESAVQVELVRVRTLLAALAPSPRPSASARTNRRTAPVAPVDAGANETDAGTPDPARWLARVELDRARLEFYSLPQEKRSELLRIHQERREAARPRETDEERRTREVEVERQQALEAARVARSEAERAMSEELLRLIALEKTLQIERQRFSELRKELGTIQDVVLGWQHRVRDAKVASASDADATYDALRRTLKAARDELERAIDDLSSNASAVPELGPDPLGNLPPDISTEPVRKRRALVARRIQEARDEERSLRESRAAKVLGEIDALNRARLDLLAHLSPDKRDAVTGFSWGGADQARSEARQLGLILDYHRYIVTEWLRSLRRGGASSVSFWGVGRVLVPGLLLLFAFRWWRRRSTVFVALIETRLGEADRNERRSSPSLRHRAFRILAAVRRPLESLLFFLTAVWLLSGSRGLLEVELLSTIVEWALGGALIVNFINALAADSSHGVASATDSAGALRLRSLQLVGRVTVAFVLVLALSSRLVGRGTIYNWVLSTCWLAVIPVFLTLVRWWRATVFERIARARRKTPTQAWVLANRSGWKSFLAAMIGAVHFFASSAFKTARNWLGGYNLWRRAHAYLFKRELDRLAGESKLVETRPVNSTALEVMKPDAIGDVWISCPADESVERLEQQLAARRGGVVAFVGGRGRGKSTILRRLAAGELSAVRFDCVPAPSLEAITKALGRDLAAEPAVVLLDDAQALVKPTIGGLEAFDQVLALARAHSASTLWVLAIDAALWPFLQRARDARPLFDEVFVLEPWREEQVGELLRQRSSRAELEPTFEDLLEKLPVSADELDRQDALVAKRSGYFRMLWDHVRGNPGLALEVWRSSLVVDAQGTARVRPLQVPDPLEISVLPDSTLFIIRAILQLAPASTRDVADATRLSHEQITNVFQFGAAHGYLSEREGRVEVTWRWLGPVLSLLERRHLMVNP